LDSYSLIDVFKFVQLKLTLNNILNIIITKINILIVEDNYNNVN